jgi:hypothetical protein
MFASTRNRLVVAALVVAATVVLAYTLGRPADPVSAEARRTAPAIPVVDVHSVAAAPHLLFRHTAIDANYNRLALAPIDAPNARRAATPLECERVGFAGGRGICLQASRGILTTFGAVVFDDTFRQLHALKLDGSPSRTRISPDGRLGAITVFVTGQEHGYSSGAFSTKTTILDLAAGAVLGDLEQFATLRGGQPFKAADFNFWGVTFADDSNNFFASLKTANQTYLVRGDVRARTLMVMHDNVECPALSPDNRRVAYKKRVGSGLAPWRFYVLDLETMVERPIAAETRSIDDQLEWLDDAHVLYGVHRSSQSAMMDVWVAPVGPGDAAQPFLVDAESPVVVR